MNKNSSFYEVILKILRVLVVAAIAVTIISHFIELSKNEKMVIEITPTSRTVSDIFSTPEDPPETVPEIQESHAESLPDAPAATTTVPTTAETDPENSGALPAATEYQASSPDNSAASTTAAVTTSAAPDVTPTPEKTSTQSGLININSAGISELMTLTGIGEVKAAAIIEYRETNGAFKNIDELLNVKGIGEKTLAKIRGKITV